MRNGGQRTDSQEQRMGWGRRSWEQCVKRLALNNVEIIYILSFDPSDTDFVVGQFGFHQQSSLFLGRTFYFQIPTSQRHG